MKEYSVTVEDIYDKNDNKKFSVFAENVQLAHKEGLRHCNALREEISKIVSKGKSVFTFRYGFSEE